MSANSDFKELLSIFNVRKVRYLIVGGYAFIKYAEPRYTKDLDLWIKADESNAAGVFAALREFGAPLAGMTEEDFAHEGYFYQMGVPPIRVDILMSIPGLDFEDAWSRKTEADFEGIPVSFISKQDLITAKLASGRPHDLRDAELLSQTED